jgi:tetratricopeptide (TPR) repeat protein
MGMVDPDRQQAAVLACLRAPELASALGVFSALAAAPGSVRQADVLHACRTTASWAEGRGRYETALQFAEAATVVAPEEPEIANLAARICRVMGERPRGELWYERAIGLARTRHDIREYIHGHLGLSTLLLERDEPAEAMEHIRTAGDTAKRFGLKPKAGEAYHDALAVAILTGDIGRAIVFAKKAVALYPRHHERYPALAYDLSLALVTWGIYEPALSILQNAVGRISAPADQLVVWGTLARAAAGAGHAATYREAVRQVMRLSAVHRQNAAAGLYSLAEAARLLDQWEEAASAARDALKIGRATESFDVVRRTEALMQDIEAKRKGVPALPANDARVAVLRGLATTVRMRIARWRGPTWRPRRKPLGAA